MKVSAAKHLKWSNCLSLWTASFTLTNINTSCPIQSSYISVANKLRNTLWTNMPKYTSFMPPSDAQVGIMIMLWVPLWHRQTEETGHVLLVNLLSPHSIPQLQWGCPVKYFSPVCRAHWFFFFFFWLGFVWVEVSGWPQLGNITNCAVYR